MSSLLASAADSDIEVTETLAVGLMLVAALVGIAVSRIRLPYTVALVVVGLLIGFVDGFTGVEITSDLILLFFLPPLLFEGAINLDLDDMRLRWKQVAVLALIGTAISAAVIAVLLTIAPGMPIELAVVIAVILAPTDPVSVLAIFKESGVGSGLRTLMEGESIFNDALAIVAYLIAIDVAFGSETVTAADALTEFGSEVLLGVAAGAIVGFAAHRLMASLDDHLVEITLSLVTAYGAYLLADRLGGSGVIAVVAAGMLIGNYGKRVAMSASSRVSMIEFWEVLAFLANSALFLIIGLEFDVTQLRGSTLVAAVVAIVGVLLGRAVIAYGLLAPFRRSRYTPIPTAWQTAVFWGGLRGSIPIALVLGLPERELAGIDAVAVVFAVVLFSLIVQGITYKPLLDRLGLTAQTDELVRYERLLGLTLALRSANAELNSMRVAGEITEPLFDEMSSAVQTRLTESERHLAEMTRTVRGVRVREARVASRRLAAVQQRVLAEASRSGRISNNIAHDLVADVEIPIEEWPDPADEPEE